MTPDDFSRHDSLDAGRLAALRNAIAKGEDQQVGVLIGELIAGWHRIVHGYIAIRRGPEIADEVMGRLQVRLGGIGERNCESRSLGLAGPKGRPRRSK